MAACPDTTDMAVKVNKDIAHIIAEYTEKYYDTWIKCALVCQAFYDVFMEDKYWETLKRRTYSTYSRKGNKTEHYPVYFIQSTGNDSAALEFRRKISESSSQIHIPSEIWDRRLLLKKFISRFQPEFVPNMQDLRLFTNSKVVAGRVSGLKGGSIHDLGYFDLEIRDNIKIVEEFIKRCPESIMYASPRLQMDRDFLLRQLDPSFTGASILPFVHVKFRDDFEFMAQAKDISDIGRRYYLENKRYIDPDAKYFTGDAERHMTESLRKRVEMMSKNPNQTSGMTYWSSGDSISYSTNVVTMHALGSLDLDSRDDEKTVEWHVRRNPEAIMYASPRLQSHKDFISQLLERVPKVLPWIHVKFRDDFEFMVYVKSFVPNAEEYVTERLRAQIKKLSV